MAHTTEPTDPDLDDVETPTMLRRWRTGRRDLLALFPLVPEYAPGTCACYARIGQHGAADLAHCVASSRPVDPTDPEAVELLRELRRIGYRVRLIRRSPHYRAIEASRAELRASRLIR